MYSINGAIFNTNQLNISTQNRALNYGDGIFETIRIKNSSPLFAECHFDRLSRATKSVLISIDIELIKKWLIDFINVSEIQNGLLKINITRHEGGLFSPINNKGDVLILGRTNKSHLIKLNNVGIYTKFEKAYSSTSAYKTTNCIEYIKAGIHKDKNNLDDLILVNRKQEVVECLYSNIIWIKDDNWFTPSLKTGCIDGVMLKQIEHFLEKRNIKITRGTYTVNELLTADTIINSNVTGIKYITKTMDKSFKCDNVLTQEIQNYFA